MYVPVVPWIQGNVMRPLHVDAYCVYLLEVRDGSMHSETSFISQDIIKTKTSIKLNDSLFIMWQQLSELCLGH